MAPKSACSLYFTLYLWNYKVGISMILNSVLFIDLCFVHACTSCVSPMVLGSLIYPCLVLASIVCLCLMLACLICKCFCLHLSYDCVCVSFWYFSFLVASFSLYLSFCMLRYWREVLCSCVLTHTVSLLHSSVQSVPCILRIFYKDSTHFS